MIIFRLAIFLALLASNGAMAIEVLPTSLESAPSPRSRHSAVAVGDKMFIWGGDTFVQVAPNSFEFRLSNDGAIYDPAANSWKAVSTFNAPSPRRSQFAQAIGDKVVVWGGCTDRDGSRCTQRATDGGIYDLTTDTWETIPAQTIVNFHEKAETSALSSIVIADELVTFGIYGLSPHAGVVKYRFADKTWTQAQDPQNLYFGWDPIKTFEWQGQALIWNPELPSFGLYDPSNSAWQEFGEIVSTRESSVLVGDEIIFAKYDSHCTEERPSFTEVLSFNVVANAWKELPPLPEAGCWNTLITNGSVLFAWGGQWNERSGPSSWAVRQTRGLYRLNMESSAWELVADDTHAAIPKINFRKVTPVIAGGYLVIWGGEIISPFPARSNNGMRIKLF